MAQQTRVILTDDLDGTEGARTYAFSWQDTSYEIDLTDAHRDEFLRALQPYIDGGRRTSPRRPPRPGRGSSTGPRTLDADDN